MRFSEILHHAGWATATIADAGHHHKLRVSYNSPASLARQINALLPDILDKGFQGEL